MGARVVLHGHDPRPLPPPPHTHTHTPQLELFSLYEEPGGGRPGSVTDPAPQERVERHMVFRTFPQIKKVRRWVRSRGRNWPRTRAHPRDELMACPRRVGASDGVGVGSAWFDDSGDPGSSSSRSMVFSGKTSRRSAPSGTRRGVCCGDRLLSAARAVHT